MEINVEKYKWASANFVSKSLWSELLLLLGVMVRRSSLILRLQHFCDQRSTTLV